MTRELQSTSGRGALFQVKLGNVLVSTYLAELELAWYRAFVGQSIGTLRIPSVLQAASARATKSSDARCRGNFVFL